MQASGERCNTGTNTEVWWRLALFCKELYQFFFKHHPCMTIFLFNNVIDTGFCKDCTGIFTINQSAALAQLYVNHIALYSSEPALQHTNAVQHHRSESAMDTSSSSSGHCFCHSYLQDLFLEVEN
jgi:hypothetical protein